LQKVLLASICAIVKERRIHLLLDMAEWGAKYEPETAGSEAWLQEVNMGKEALIQLIRETVQEGGSIFMGKENVLSKLQKAK
jgi:hypothetical protein